MTKAKIAAAALAVAAACSVASPAPADDTKSPSAFLQCDGRVGHVTDGARFMRLLLVTATAGISEAAMSKNDADKRAKGAAGVAACDQAIASERDGYRRMQLALARVLHFGEDKKWADAAAAAKAVPQYLGANAGDWALTKSATSKARYLQAVYLVRAGRTGDAEAAAWDGVRFAGPDVMTLMQIGRFMHLSRAISPEKRAALEAMQRYYPDAAGTVANGYAEAGDFKSAAAAIRGYDGAIRAFAKDPKPMSSVHSMLATLAALDGNITEAKAELIIAKTALERARSEGMAVSEATNFASREDDVAFAEAAMAAASGEHDQAAKILGARSSWPTISPGIVSILVERVAPKVPESARVGVLAKGAGALWQEAVDARLTLLRNSDKDAGLWGFTWLLEQDEAFQKLARAAASGGAAKPKWLLGPGKEPRDYDILAAGPDAPGWEAGEGLLFHAALIARARGKQGFVLFPKRDRLHVMVLRFVNPGELGIPQSSMVMADDVIAALSPHIRADQR